VLFRRWQPVGPLQFRLTYDKNPSGAEAEELHTITTIWIPILHIAGAYGHSRLSESIVPASVALFSALAPMMSGSNVSLKGKEAQ
jgi:hypothetical protein